MEEDNDNDSDENVNNNGDDAGNNDDLSRLGYFKTKKTRKKVFNDIKGGPKKTFLFKNGFCSGSFILLYFYVKLLVPLNIIEMKVHKKFHVKI